MKTNEPTVCEAYVIESDGSKTAVPIGFADEGFRARRTTPRSGARAYADFPFSAGFASRGPVVNNAGAAAMPRRKLHLGRRIAGLAIAMIGVPLLILPGPGLALIGLGLMMATMP